MRPQIAIQDEALIDRVAEKAGGFPALAEKLGISRAAVHQWKRIPAERVLDVESLTGIPRHELRPDLYPNDQAA